MTVRGAAGICPGFMKDARTIQRGEEGYPSSLARISGAPERLRVCGDLGVGRHAKRVAVVGTRNPDAYGVEMAARMAADLARAGVSVVSGGAEGIDTAAHRGALEAGGHTVAVFGCGLDVTYPQKNRALFEEIAGSGGALISEYEDSRAPTRYTFPERNRIISGLSDAVVVVRAGDRSGALITARWARRQGIPVFAVPGDVGNPLSFGSIDLLRAGARVAAGAADVLAPIGLQLPLGLATPAAAAFARPPESLGGPAAAVLEALGPTPRHAEEVALAAKLDPGPALAALLDLELEGLCEQRPGQYFVRRR